MAKERRLVSEVELWDTNAGMLDHFPKNKRKFMNKFSLPSRSAVFDTFRRTFFFLSPTFIQSCLLPPQPTSASRKLQPTAWVDGMRGIAAFLVFVYHLLYTTHDVRSAWGAGEDGTHREILRLPLIRFFYNGDAMVAIFFVLSGYALSYKPVKQMRSHQWNEVSQGLSSSVFRRVWRLYLPCVASTFIIIVLLRLGFYEKTRELAGDATRLWGYREWHPWRLGTLYDQLSAWLWVLWTFWLGNPDLDEHLWTIPIEFRDSIVLFTTQLGVCRLRPRYRLTLLIIFMACAHQVNAWHMMSFYGGFFLAELDIRRSSKAALSLSDTTLAGTIHSKAQRAWSTLYVITFVAGMYLCGQPGSGPAGAERSPGWATLTSLIPRHIEHRDRYWTGWGSLLLIWSTSNSKSLQRIFNNRVSQYLGKISFSLYLVHGAIIHTLHYRLIEMLWEAIGTDTYMQKEASFVISALVVTTFAIWESDLFMRVVDVPSVKFARWLEVKCMGKTPAIKEEPAWKESGAIV